MAWRLSSQVADPSGWQLASQVWEAEVFAGIPIDEIDPDSLIGLYLQQLYTPDEWATILETEAGSFWSIDPTGEIDEHLTVAADSTYLYTGPFPSEPYLFDLIRNGTVAQAGVAYVFAEANVVMVMSAATAGMAAQAVEASTRVSIELSVAAIGMSPGALLAMTSYGPTLSAASVSMSGQQVEWRSVLVAELSSASIQMSPADPYALFAQIYELSAGQILMTPAAIDYSAMQSYAAEMTAPSLGMLAEDIDYLENVVYVAELSAAEIGFDARALSTDESYVASLTAPQIRMVPSSVSVEDGVFTGVVSGMVRSHRRRRGKL